MLKMRTSNLRLCELLYDSLPESQCHATELLALYNRSENPAGGGLVVMCWA